MDCRVRMVLTQSLALTSNGGEKVTITGSVDTDTLGSYTITYTATDANGNDRHSHKNSKCSRYYSPSNNSLDRRQLQ